MQLFKTRKTKIFSIIILDNNLSILPSDILKFKYSELANDIENTVAVKKIRYQ
tara:strand:+ start:1645 stop:1803 length:159 start_codon:yes stop_codon:yes gene_type:complete